MSGATGAAPPGPVALPAALRRAIVGHALAEAPLEACGLVIGDAPWALGGRPLRFLPATNALAAPDRFEVDAAELVRATVAADERGEAVWAVVHSHPRSDARPSSTDLAAAHDPGALHLIVGPLLPDRTPLLRAWAIAGGTATELPLGPA
ncbi:MAG: hypothetical protein RL338_637 [Chloroflexota bacterium]